MRNFHLKLRPLLSPFVHLHSVSRLKALMTADGVHKMGMT